MADSARCATCGRVDHRIKVDLPHGYVLECERCRAGTPGKPMKQVRHCSICHEPIITMGLSGGVRLTCNNCAKKDPKLVSVEAAVQERDKLREKLNEVLANRTEAETELDKLRDNFEQRFIAKNKEILEENEALKYDLRQREETSLAARVQAKMKLKYGESEKQRIRDFARWVQERGWPEGWDVEALVDEFCKG